MRAWIYDRFVSGMTAAWYREVLQRVPPGSRLLDVGVGTGAGLVSCADLLHGRDLTVVGLDIDADYLRRCRRELALAGLDRRVRVHQMPVEDHVGGPYQAAYFSASLMLMPDPAAAIARVAGLLAPGGHVYATQTFQTRRSRFVERAKPMIKHVTTVEFGQVTYEDDFRRCLDKAGVDLIALEVIGGSRAREHRLAVARAAA